MWHHRGGRIKIKLKTDRSMRLVASDSATPTFLFSMYEILGTFQSFSFLLEHINRTLKG
jgi:hypothetical protein